MDVIAPIRQYWLTHIIELIPGDLHAVEKEKIEYLIDSMLNEINKDYFDSVRKSILDYILKSESEMKRLGIQQVLNQPIDWGDDFYKGIEPNEEWKHNVMMARMLMSENLCICSQATLELMKLWQDYKSHLFVNLPEPREAIYTLQDFISQQEAQMTNIKGLLISDWTKSAVDILREELLNLDKDQQQKFFESAATLMSNQVRELIYQSIRKYVDFIKHFKKDSYPTPPEVLGREYDADTSFEENFISVKLDIEGTQIVFADDLEEKIQPELENIIDAIVKQSHNLPRPENTIARGDKMHLWTVPDDDEVAEDAKRTVSVIIEENRKVVEQALHVYDDYMWILTEGDRVKEFVKIEPKVRKDYQAQVDKYKQTIEEIRLKMPFELRMNMFLIECKDLNDMLCDRLTQLMHTVLDNASEHVFSKLCTQIQSDVKQIKDDLAQRAQASKVLVQYEQRLEKLQNED